jgi:HD-GYP domain-containing protein (c-di-GMP phosphodiesterase class II)
VDRIHVKDLKRGMIMGQDVPSPEPDKAPLVRKGVVLTDELLHAMRRYGLGYVVIDDAATYRRKMLLENDARFPPVIKPEPIVTPRLRDDAVKGLEGLFSTIAIGAEDIHASSQIVRQLDMVVSELVDVLLKDQRAIVNISDLKSYDDYTYHHSLSVAVLSIAIGKYLSFNRLELNRLGMSAIMHDIGKTSIPLAIINKSTKLNREEYSLMKTHSPEGYDYLQRTTIGDDEIRRSVLLHHEKIDGTGYPYGAKGQEIPVWSRIISVADVYDALTSDRPYRKPMPSAEALEYIMGGIDSSFDYDVVSAFVKKVELYPVGSFVELSTGETAVVLGSEYPFRPVVRLVKTGEVIDLCQDRKYFNVVVKRLLTY